MSTSTTSGGSRQESLLAGGFVDQKARVYFTGFMSRRRDFLGRCSTLFPCRGSVDVGGRPLPGRYE